MPLELLHIKLRDRLLLFHWDSFFNLYLHELWKCVVRIVVDDDADDHDHEDDDAYKILRISKIFLPLKGIQVIFKIISQVINKFIHKDLFT